MGEKDTFWERRTGFCSFERVVETPPAAPPNLSAPNAFTDFALFVVTENDPRSSKALRGSFQASPAANLTGEGQSSDQTESPQTVSDSVGGEPKSPKQSNSTKGHAVIVGGHPTSEAPTQ